jgi:hypothetical protein
VRLWRRFRLSQFLCLRICALRGNRTRGLSFGAIHIRSSQNFRSCCCCCCCCFMNRYTKGGMSELIMKSLINYFWKSLFKTSVFRAYSLSWRTDATCYTAVSKVWVVTFFHCTWKAISALWTPKFTSVIIGHRRPVLYAGFTVYVALFFSRILMFTCNAV